MSHELEAHDSSHIWKSLAVNVVIAIGKTIAALLTKSGAMLAESIHSFADCANQILLLIGVSRARRKPSEKHPLGYGRELYFWSFMVALLLFFGGGVVSIREGIEKLIEPTPVEHPALAFLVLFVSMALEGWALWDNWRDVKKRKGTRTLLQYLRETKDSDLVMVFGENASAVLGLLTAAIFLGLATLTGRSQWDAIGSICVGLVLIAVATFLAMEIRSLLLGEAADGDVEPIVREVALEFPQVDRVLNVVAVQQGPHEVLIALKLSFRPDLSIVEVCDTINALEARLRAENAPTFGGVSSNPIDRVRPPYKRDKTKPSRRRKSSAR